MSEHTPGPWRTRDSGMGLTSRHVFGPKGQYIAEIWGDATIRPANARLIAVAPEMLIALEEVDSVINRDGIQSIQEWDKRLRAVSITLRKIIAKAKGEPTPPAT